MSSLSKSVPKLCNCYSCHHVVGCLCLVLLSVFVFKDEHRLNSARLCLIILTCIAEVWEPTVLQQMPPSTFSINLTIFVLILPCMIGPVCWCLSSWWQYELQSQSPSNGEFMAVLVTLSGDRRNYKVRSESPACFCYAWSAYIVVVSMNRC